MRTRGDMIRDQAEHWATNWSLDQLEREVRRLRQELQEKFIFRAVYEDEVRRNGWQT